MTSEPPEYVRRSARAVLDAGATLVAGHSAHVFHGVTPRCIYDLGDFVDDYACDRELRNDLGLLFFVTFDGPVPVRVEALPLRLDFCFTRLATGPEQNWIMRRFESACHALGGDVARVGDRLVIEWDAVTT
jgi:poly-gamma-glutamate synthesis protein (capsule biosynthesis protein)